MKHFYFVLFVFLFSGCTQAPVSVVSRGVASLNEQTKIEGIWELQGSHSERGPYTGDLQLTKKSNGTYSVIRLVNYVSFYSEGLRVQEVWTGTAALSSGNLVVTYELSKGQFLTEYGILKRGAQLLGEKLVVNEFFKVDTRKNLQANMSLPKGGEYREWLTARADQNPSPLWKPERFVFQTSDGKSKGAEVAIIDKTDYQFYQKNNDTLRVVNKTVDLLNLAEERFKRDAYSMSLATKEMAFLSKLESSNAKSVAAFAFKLSVSKDSIDALNFQNRFSELQNELNLKIKEVKKISNLDLSALIISYPLANENEKKWITSVLLSNREDEISKSFALGVEAINDATKVSHFISAVTNLYANKKAKISTLHLFAMQSLANQLKSSDLENLNKEYILKIWQNQFQSREPYFILLVASLRINQGAKSLYFDKFVNEAVWKLRETPFPGSTEKISVEVQSKFRNTLLPIFESEVLKTKSLSTLVDTSETLPATQSFASDYLLGYWFARSHELINAFE